MTLSELETLSHRLADAAARITLPLFRAGIDVDNKAADAFDPVTEADRAAESAMREILKREHPDHGIVGEEFGTSEGNGRYQWVIDPIDGTRSFMAGVPLWTTIIGLRIDGVPRFGLVDQPYIGDRFWGGDGKAYARNRWGRTTGIRTRTCPDISQASLMTTTPALMTGPGERARYDAVEQAVRLARYGADGYAYCLLAAGHIDLVVEAGLEPYDVVGLVPIIEAAGGIMTSWTGASANNGGTVIAAGDPRIHASALNLLRDDEPG
jgi:histidinol phosphatase-like enzyme (inositol monophosphatase family)